MEKIDYNSQVLVSASNYDLKQDKRFLVPFLNGTKIGFVNAEGEMVIKPQFTYVLDNFYHEKSLVRVGEVYAKAYSRKTSDPAVYLYKRFGLLKSDGSFLLPMEYDSITMPKFSDAITIHSLSKGYAVIDDTGNFIITFGVYNYIDGFDRGYARIKINNITNGLNNSDSGWGIIRDTGEIVLKPVYNSIWNFYDKALYYTKVITADNTHFEFHFNDGSLHESGYQAKIDAEIKKGLDDYRSLQEYRESTYYDYNGSYAQDVMGYSDQSINDAFDGDPEAYWNID